MPYNHQKYPIQFPLKLYDALSGLAERGGMTPTALSSLGMLVILPAQLIVNNRPALENDENGFCTKESLFKRLPDSNQTQARSNNNPLKTHTLKSLSVNGLETLEAMQKEQVHNQQYEIFYCGNGQDAMNFMLASSRISQKPNRNYIFWNYPEVGHSQGKTHSAYDLFKAGYQQAKRLIDDKGIPAENITLHGFSLGGGVATHVACQLHEEGHRVNLEIDRSFARIASFLPAKLKRSLTNETTAKQSPYAPLITSIVAFAVSGFALGTTLAGLVSSLGLLVASMIAAIGYMLALGIQALGCVQTASGINTICSSLALYSQMTVNCIAIITGILVAIGGLIAGVLVGLVFGALLSIQLLWTEQPLTMPMTPAFSALLYSLCCEMDSVSAMQRLLKADSRTEHPAKISVTNVLDDEVIDTAASLNMGLGLKPGKQPENENQPLKAKVSSFWYRSGGHNGSLFSFIDNECILNKRYD